MYHVDRKITIFAFLLLTITLLGLCLRLIDYDRLPGWRESDDEIHYAWTGLTWLKTGTPQSWSNMEIYSQIKIFNIWNSDWRLVKPILEKPPLYSLLSGLTVILAGETELNSVRLSTIRLLPILLSIFTISLTGIVATQVFGKRIGLIAALLYATTPTIVMANRLSVTENLMVPLVLITSAIFLYGQNKSNQQLIFPFLVGIGAGLTALTKQNGITCILTLFVLYIYFKQWRSAVICAIVSLSILSIYFFIGAYYDFPLFLRTLKELRLVGLQGGLPQLVITLLGRPLITTQTLFYDGSILFGLILLLSSPWWLYKNNLLINISALNHLKGGRMDSFQVMEPENTRQLSIYAFLLFPLTYILYLGLTITGAESIGSGQGFWGWYAYPLFPYAVTLVSVILYRLWRTPAYYLLLIAVLILGSSTVRFFFLQLPHKYHFYWQNTLIGLIVFSGLILIPRKKFKKTTMLILFLLFIGVNIYTSTFLYKIYPVLPQPLP